jgi:hypothetical protein
VVVLPSGISVSAFHTCCWNAVPFAASFTVKAVSRPAKYSPSWSRTPAKNESSFRHQSVATGTSRWDSGYTPVSAWPSLTSNQLPMGDRQRV